MTRSVRAGHSPTTRDLPDSGPPIRAATKSESFFQQNLISKTRLCVGRKLGKDTVIMSGQNARMCLMV
jgi:hypothetical protein